MTVTLTVPPAAAPPDRGTARAPAGAAAPPTPARRSGAGRAGASALVVTMPESRPPAYGWPVRAGSPHLPHQPLLDLQTSPAPVVLTCPDDLARRASEGLPDARAWSVALATTVLEIVLARRSPAQLSRWVSEEVFVALPRVLPNRPAQAALRAAGDGSARLQSVRLQHPATGVAEASVHARFGARSLAIALRLEVSRSRWLCTALDLGVGEPAPAGAP